MRTRNPFFVTVCAMLFSGFETLAQSEQKVKVDPGISVHNYKHPHKAKKAESLQKVRKSSRFASRVGIVPRAIIAPRMSAQSSTPKYKRRSAWSFFKKSNPTPTKLNPLTNPGNYKTQH